MLRRVLAGHGMLTMAALAAALAAAIPARAAEKPPAVTGLYLTTRYPSLTVRAGEATTLDLALHNYGLPPQQVSVAVPEAAKGWKAAILGGGQPVAAVVAPPDSEADLQLRLEPPAGAGPDDYHFTVEAKNADHDLRLPITVTIGKQLPAKLKLTTEFPSLRGSPSTAFKYRVTVANDSGRDTTVNFTADAPKNFRVNFTQAYETQQITSIPIKAGKSKDIEASITLPNDTPAGAYAIVFHAKSAAASAAIKLGMTIVGQPSLSLTGEGDRLSGSAYAGQSNPLTIVLRNNGSAPARDIELSATTPEGWQASFDPKKLPELAARKTARVKVSLTPSPRAIAGDYQATILANAADGLSESQNFRITVLTSTLWGAVGIAIIAVALLVVVFAVGRFGRR